MSQTTLEPIIFLDDLDAEDTLIDLHRWEMEEDDFDTPVFPLCKFIADKPTVRIVVQ